MNFLPALNGHFEQYHPQLLSPHSAAVALEFNDEEGDEERRNNRDNYADNDPQCHT